MSLLYQTITLYFLLLSKGIFNQMYEVSNYYYFILNIDLMKFLIFTHISFDSGWRKVNTVLAFSKSGFSGFASNDRNGLLKSTTPSLSGVTVSGAIARSASWIKFIKTFFFIQENTIAVLTECNKVEVRNKIKLRDNFLWSYRPKYNTSRYLR